jgi:tetratricopeptide (TPR) repeat protein
MVRKLRVGIMLAMALCAALAAAGCKDADVKQVYEAEKLKKAGDHVRAVELFSEVASKPNLSEEAEQFIQINFCQHYGNPERANDPKVMTRKNMEAVARSCADFYRNYPNRTSEGLGPFQTGALWSKLGEYEKAVEAFILAEEKGFYDPQKTAGNKKNKESCVLLYKAIMEAGMKMPGEDGRQTMAMAVRGMQTKCRIDVGVVK